MQMTQCTPQNALAFLQQVHPVINTPLTHSRQTLLMLAASISSTNLVQATLRFKPELHLKDSIGRSALHFAAAVGSI
jgi:ankyrin repeat protein